MRSGSRRRIPSREMGSLGEPLLSDEDLDDVAAFYSDYSDADKEDESSTDDSASDATPSDSISETTSSTSRVAPTMFTVGAALLAMGGAASSVLAMLTPMLIVPATVFVAGGICILSSPFVVVRQYYIGKAGGLRQHITQFRKDINLLQEEVSMLRETVTELQNEAESMQDVEEQLAAIAQRQGKTSDEVISMVNENESNLKQMEDIVREVSLAQVMRVLLRSDRTNSMSFDSQSEIDDVMLRIKVQLSAHGVDMDEETFKTIIQRNGDVTHVLKLVAAVMFGEKIDGQDLEEHLKESRASLDRRQRNQMMARLLKSMSSLLSEEEGGDEEIRHQALPGRRRSAALKRASDNRKRRNLRYRKTALTDHGEGEDDEGGTRPQAAPAARRKSAALRRASVNPQRRDLRYRPTRDDSDKPDITMLARRPTTRRQSTVMDEILRGIVEPDAREVEAMSGYISFSDSASDSES